MDEDAVRLNRSLWCVHFYFKSEFCHIGPMLIIIVNGNISLSLSELDVWIQRIESNAYQLLYLIRIEE